MYVTFAKKHSITYVASVENGVCPSKGLKVLLAMKVLTIVI